MWRSSREGVFYHSQKGAEGRRKEQELNPCGDLSCSSRDPGAALDPWGQFLCHHCPKAMERAGTASPGPGKSCSISGTVPCNYLGLSCPPRARPTQPRNRQRCRKRKHPQETQRLLRLFLQGSSAPRRDPRPSCSVRGAGIFPSLGSRLVEWFGMKGSKIPAFPTPCCGQDTFYCPRVLPAPSSDTSRDGTPTFSLEKISIPAPPHLCYSQFSQFGVLLS